MFMISSPCTLMTPTVNFELLDRLALHVGLCVKVTEQQDERDHVADQCVMHPERKLASRNDSIDAEHHGHGELNQLKDCQNEEESVGELEHLGKIVPPDGIHNLRWKKRRTKEN
uniref:Uncharacterized protein n=1 Tax=Anopheles coluzzii TaxID=1518534 RepID=A0A8W7P978_ANOCL